MNIPEFATVLTAVMRHNMCLHDEGASIKDYLVPMAWGDPGLGKSDIAGAVADESMPTSPLAIRPMGRRSTQLTIQTIGRSRVAAALCRSRRLLQPPRCGSANFAGRVP
jgi:hypothetical protein